MAVKSSADEPEQASESGAGQSPEGNCGTRMVSVPWCNEAPWSFERLFSYHFEAIKGLYEGARGPGFLVVAVHANRTLASSETIALRRENGDHAMVVGRHARVGLRLHQDPSVALRHLLMRVTRDDAGDPMVRILDLHTGQGFCLDESGPCSSLVSNSDLSITLGSYSILFFALADEPKPWPDDPSEAWEQRGSVRILDYRGLDLERISLPPRIEPAGEDGFDEDHSVSHITLVPGTSSSDHWPKDVPFPENTFATLTMVRSDAEIVHPVTMEQLKRGLLLGRYQRCDVGGKRLWDTPHISRVHLLLLEDNGRILAIDTASTNGTAINGSRVDVSCLPERARIDLGRTRRFRWEVLKQPEQPSEEAND